MADLSRAQPSCTADAFRFLRRLAPSLSLWTRGRQTQLSHRGHALRWPGTLLWTFLLSDPTMERGIHRMGTHYTTRRPAAPPPTKVFTVPPFPSQDVSSLRTRAVPLESRPRLCLWCVQRHSFHLCAIRRVGWRNVSKSQDRSRFQPLTPLTNIPGTPSPRNRRSFLFPPGHFCQGCFEAGPTHSQPRRLALGRQWLSFIHQGQGSPGHCGPCPLCRISGWKRA